MQLNALFFLVNAMTATAFPYPSHIDISIERSTATQSTIQSVLATDDFPDFLFTLAAYDNIPKPGKGVPVGVTKIEMEQKN